MEQVLYSLPDGWKYQKLKTLIKMHYGKALKATDRIEGEVPVYGSNGVVGSHNEHLWDQPTVVIGRKGSVGEANLAFTPSWTIDTAYYVEIIDHNVLNLMYFYYFADRFDVSSISQKGVKPGINRNDYLNLSFPLPPINEQERIVEKLDALLTRIDTAIEHLQSKLDLSKQLFDSVLDEFFKLSDCDSVPLTEVVNFIGGSQPPKSQFSDVQKEGYVRLIQIRDYKTDNHIVYVDSASTKKFCTKDDVMIGRYGPPVFQILRGLDGAYNVALMKAVPNEDVLTKDYLFWFLQSPSIQNYVIGISQRAAGQSGVNKKALEKYLIPVPSKTIQNDIVDKVGQLVNKSRNLEAEVTAEITSLNQLKASILDSAFKGEL
ncbi:restriction endonuclease subunit S [Halopseudomonas aestusnigri]|uniref:restriction endonuclease subunit S n=1 Tax=Halopseudomonas aestusnigri TaxID=857252 RepID=UPI001E446ABF|nr:restriction endonuclease subunit S [Halopseudomonas aestusnigri]UGV30411.1 restriction endonuclease subunit S [Halopseudomonas aestusnigri]